MSIKSFTGIFANYISLLHNLELHLCPKYTNALIPLVRHLLRNFQFLFSLKMQDCPKDIFEEKVVHLIRQLVTFGYWSNDKRKVIKDLCILNSVHFKIQQLNVRRQAVNFLYSFIGNMTKEDIHEFLMPIERQFLEGLGQMLESWCWQENFDMTLFRALETLLCLVQKADLTQEGLGAGNIQVRLISILKKGKTLFRHSYKKEGWSEASVKGCQRVWELSLLILTRLFAQFHPSPDNLSVLNISLLKQVIYAISCRSKLGKNCWNKEDFALVCFSYLIKALDLPQYARALCEENGIPALLLWLSGKRKSCVGIEISTMVLHALNQLVSHGILDCQERLYCAGFIPIILEFLSVNHTYIFNQSLSTSEPIAALAREVAPWMLKLHIITASSSALNILANLNKTPSLRLDELELHKAFRVEKLRKVLVYALRVLDYIVNSVNSAINEVISEHGPSILVKYVGSGMPASIFLHSLLIRLSILEVKKLIQETKLELISSKFKTSVSLNHMVECIILTDDEIYEETPSPKALTNRAVHQEVHQISEEEVEILKVMKATGRRMKKKELRERVEKRRMELISSDESQLRRQVIKRRRRIKPQLIIYHQNDESSCPAETNSEELDKSDQVSIISINSDDPDILEKKFYWESLKKFFEINNLAVGLLNEEKQLQAACLFQKFIEDTHNPETFMREIIWRECYKKHETEIKSLLQGSMASNKGIQEPADKKDFGVNLSVHPDAGNRVEIIL